MMMAIPTDLLNLINSAEPDSLVAVYVKKLICDKDIEFETTIKQKIDKIEKKIYYCSICYEIDKIPFPEPHINRVYFFLPKSKSYALALDAKQLIEDFDRVIQVVGKKPEEVRHLYPKQNLIDNNLTDEQIKNQKKMLSQEDVSKFPSAFQMARNLIKTGWDSAKNVALGNQLLASSEEAYRRLTICESCPNYKEKRCTLCGCFMEQKAHFQAADCPANKW